MKTCALVLALCACAAAITRDQFYPHGPGLDQRLPRGSEIPSPEIKLKVPVLFYGETYDSVFVNNYGVLSFRADIPSFLNAEFPLPYASIAPFYCNIDTSDSGAVYFRETNEPHVLSKAEESVINNFPEYDEFKPKSVFIATWLEVTYKGHHSDRSNTFQAAVISDGNETFVEFLYPEREIQWIQREAQPSSLPDAKAQAGFIAEDGRIFILRGSGTHQIRNIISWSNTHEPGKYVFRVGKIPSDGNIALPDLYDENEVEEQEESKTCAQSGPSICHMQATCVDYQNGICCQCNEGYYGNGKSCIKNDHPIRVHGKLNGAINDISLNDIDIQAYIVVADGRAYTALSQVPPTLGPSLQLLNVLGGAIGWLFAKPLGTAKNGYQLTGGLFNHTASILFTSTGDRVTINQEFSGHDVFDQIVLDTDVRGTVPVLVSGTKLEVSEYEEQFTPEPGLLRSEATRIFTNKITGEKYEQRISQTFTFNTCRFAPTADEDNLPSTLKVAKNYLGFENKQNIVRYGMSNKIVPLGQEDPCKEGRATCGPHSTCVVKDDSFSCVCQSGFSNINIDNTPSCIDIDECEAGTHNCDINADCYNHDGGFQCRCRSGYEGSGVSCNRVNVCKNKYCDPNAQCLEQYNGAEAICVCNPGYTGDGLRCSSLLSQPRPCDICSPYAYCVFDDIVGAQRCKCWEGYIGDGRYCSEIGQEKPYNPSTSQYNPIPTNNEPNPNENNDPPSNSNYDPYASSSDINVPYDPNSSTPDPNAPYDPNAPSSNSDTAFYPHHGLPDYPNPTPYNPNPLSYDPYSQNSNPSPSQSFNPYPTPWRPAPNQYNPYSTPLKPNPPPEPYPSGDSYTTTPITPNFSEAEYNDEFTLPHCDEKGCYCPPNYSSYPDYRGNELCRINTYKPPPYDTEDYYRPANTEFSNETTISCYSDTDCPSNAYCYVPPENSTATGHCICNEGYVADGYECKSTESCNCGFNAHCLENAECVCNLGYRGDGYTCTPNHRCITSNDCENHAECRPDAIGEYICQCVSGYVKDVNDACVPDDQSCNNAKCVEHASCLYDQSIDLRYCACDQGYEGDGINQCSEQGTTCEVTNDCHLYAACMPEGGSYQCVCNEGYVGDGYQCTLEENCRNNPYMCDVHASCVKRNNVYVCECNTGYSQNGSSCVLDPRQSGNFLVASDGASVYKVPFKTSPKEFATPINSAIYQIAVGIDVDCVSGRIFWGDVVGNAIRRTAYDGSGFESFLSNNVKSPEGVSVDWSARNIFWTDSKKLTIEVANLDTKLRKVIFSSDGITNPRGIAVHPQRGKIFWSDWNRTAPKIEWANMDGSERGVFLDQSEVKLPNSLAIDWLRDRLCYADAGTFSIKCISIDTQEKETIAERCSYPFGLAINGNTFYWSDWKTLKIESIDTLTQKKGLLPISTSSRRLYGVAIAPSECPASSNMCQYRNGNCQQDELCLPDGRGSRTCVQGEKSFEYDGSY